MPPDQDLHHVLTTLGLSRHAELLAPHWGESMSSLPPPGSSFLCPVTLRRELRYGSTPDGAVAALCDIAERVRQHPELFCLAWHCHRLLFEHLDYGAERIQQWPDLDAVLPGQSGAFYLLIAADSIPLTRAKHRELGIPETITRANCTNVRVHGERHLLATGTWGTEQRLLPWLRNHTTGILFRLGRFQYMLKPFRGQVTVFRRRDRDAIVALANDGVEYTATGIILNPTRFPGRRWTARLTEDDETFTGNPVTPTGYAQQRPLTLSKGSWDCVLRQGDAMLEMHIPPGGDMTPERCVESMQMAVEFFADHFPDQPFSGFVCSSWVLNPRFGTILAPDANIRLFEEQVYLYPIPSGGRDGLYFIFGKDDIDPATAPRNTSIQRALLEELDAGRPLLSGGMFLLQDDLRQFGTQFYRTHWPRAEG